jgi:hypothetical protein
MSKVIEIQTSCGQVFHLTIDEMSDRQLTGLIEQNPGHPDTELMRAALVRRQEARKAALDGARAA